MLETYSYTAGMVAQDVRDKFGDTGNVQITDPMLIRWINNGQREIASSTPFLEKVGQTALVAGQSVYDLTALFAAGRMQQLSTVMLNGNYAKIIQWADFQNELAQMSAQTQTSDSVTTVAIYADKLNVWPIPTTTVANGITLYYTALPADVAALTDTLTVPDRFFNALDDYVLAQALELDENFQAGQVKLGHYKDRMIQQLSKLHETPSDFYAVVGSDLVDDRLG